ncbi:MAG: HDIG domain-containing protein [Candidatus Aenigmarchaeota archaeon]|nr:HDIG domain-containing protein [Candidatus Aenigmarchaeota archaeon]
MSFKTEQARRLMRLKLITQPQVISHIEMVTKKAVEIGRILREKGFDVDLELIEMGGYLHDIGRSVTHGVSHAVESGKILTKLGFSEALIRMVERHVGAGITAEEARKLGLPVQNYIPETLEEKILAYADKFLESEFVFKTVNDEQVAERKDVDYGSIEPTLDRFRKLFGQKSPVVLRLENLRDEIENLINCKRECNT